MPAVKRFLFVPLSSFGYLFPAVKVAHVLMEWGDDVHFLTSIRYEPLLRLYGIPTLGISNNRSEHPFLHPALWYDDPLLEEVISAFDQVVNHVRPDAIVSTPLTLPAFITAERHGIPLIVIGFSEYLFPGIGEQNRTKAWRLGEFTGFYNKARARLDLPPVPVSVEATPLLGDRYLIRNIPELDDARTLPPQVSYAGGLYWEPEYHNPALARFLKTGQQPVVYVQLGRLFNDGALWGQLLTSFAELPYRFVVDVGRADYLAQPHQIPANLFLAPFIPLGKYADVVALVLCTAQSTSVISAILHGKPIVSLPHSDDAKELTVKIEAYQIGRRLTQVSTAALRECFDEVQQSPYRDNVLAYRQLFERYDDASQIYATIHAVFGT